MHTEPRALSARSPARFVPPLVWMGVIAVGSSSLLSGDRTGRWMVALLGSLAPWASPATLEAAHIGLRKLGHLVEFGILAVLWHRSLTPSPRAVAGAFVLAAAYGGLDELRQGLEPSRTPAVSDVAVDALGAWLALAAWTQPGSLQTATLRAAAWGIGLLAGLAVLGVALEATLGRPAPDTGIAALGLALLAVGLARLARDPRRRTPPDPPRPGPA
jgi:VanZ family protein